MGVARNLPQKRHQLAFNPPHLGRTPQILQHRLQQPPFALRRPMLRPDVQVPHQTFVLFENVIRVPHHLPVENQRIAIQRVDFHKLPYQRCGILKIPRQRISPECRFFRQQIIQPRRPQMAQIAKFRLSQ